MAFALCSLLVIVLNEMRDKGIKMWKRITETLSVSKQKLGGFTGHFLQMEEFCEVDDEKNVGNEIVKYYHWDCLKNRICGISIRLTQKKIYLKISLQR